MRKTVLPVVVLLLSLVVFRPSVGMTAPQSPALSPPISAQATGLCPALDPPSGNTVDVDTVSELIAAVNNAAVGDTILVADGTYTFGGGDYLWVDVAGVTIRSASGNREAVIIDGDYKATELILIVASNVTIADLTLREAYAHPLHVMSTSSSDTLNTLIYNVHIVDPGEQAIKINPYQPENALYFIDGGEVACSHIELTDAGRPHIRNNCYTGGVDAHQAQGWTIRDNVIEGFWCDTGLSEHAIHMWKSCRDTVVERNILSNNARGVGFGMDSYNTGVRTYSPDPCPSASGGYVDHYGGIIRNNSVFANDSRLFDSPDGFDSGISLWQACGAWVVHNTVVSTQQPEASSIEWRYDHTDVDLVNNLVSYRLWDRGGTDRQASNLEYQPLSLFVDGSSGDLHLVSTATGAIDQGAEVASGTCDDDIDGDIRPIGSARDVGADEYGISAPAAVTDLQITSAVTGTYALTVTLSWTPPSGAVTTTLRYSGVPITMDNWGVSMLLTDTLTGTASAYMGGLPYEGGTIYFAQRSENEGGMSGLSNLAFWPHHDVFLPVVLRAYAP